ncbi:ribosome-associated protein [Isoptericola sp. CG 20/1183]|uniref:Ribosome-associated protein n=1 Tax=Isoptericola halotolerans TaxID=300560 RepID=A0ABX5EF96_9MICO|nr:MULTISPECIES: RNA-binding S4 domain-containing protein [Isoptericola]PRZ05559.1 ribosome-associated protein [Isoptericola halotolerans]PRZ06127.1 ribosome-associated protein [Isoptericola sp. CG 20/1183]
MDTPLEVPIRDDVIRLGQFLKLAGLAESGNHARDLVADGDVRVDGETENRRGRQLRPGARVTVVGPEGEETAVVVQDDM